ncbi:hypothetical protein VZ95_20150 [Elstera litoralis]|uniref:Uncharacterized protein n=1 Tax=Elstera litoralis TaxID=552518 RepID=A0A0F3IL31_9PROT|nr:hypothetical protein VZ95_20150 [Elstera litoralis]
MQRVSPKCICSNLEYLHYYFFSVNFFSLSPDFTNFSLILIISCSVFFSKNFFLHLYIDHQIHKK